MSAPAQLRPMEFGDILDSAFKLYRAEFVRMFTAALIAYLPNLLMELWIAATVDPTDPAAAAGLTLIRLPVSLVTFVLVYGTLTYQADRALHGTPVSAGAALSGAAGRLLPLLGAYLLVAMAVLAGLVFLIVPGIIIGLMFFAVGPAVVLERMGPIASLSRSRELSRGALGRIAGVLIVATIITMLPGFVIGVVGGVVAVASMVAGGSPSTAMFGISALQVLVAALAAPFSCAVYVLLYYDRRIRTEALDVQMAAERLEAPVAAV